MEYIFDWAIYWCLNRNLVVKEPSVKFFFSFLKLSTFVEELFILLALAIVQEFLSGKPNSPSSWDLSFKLLRSTITFWRTFLSVNLQITTFLFVNLWQLWSIEGETFTLVIERTWQILVSSSVTYCEGYIGYFNHLATKILTGIQWFSF